MAPLASLLDAHNEASIASPGTSTKPRPSWAAAEWPRAVLLWAPTEPTDRLTAGRGSDPFGGPQPAIAHQPGHGSRTEPALRTAMGSLVYGGLHCQDVVSGRAELPIRCPRLVKVTIKIRD